MTLELQLGRAIALVCTLGVILYLRLPPIPTSPLIAQLTVASNILSETPSNANRSLAISQSYYTKFGESTMVSRLDPMVIIQKSISGKNSLPNETFAHYLLERFPAPPPNSSLALKSKSTTSRLSKYLRLANQVEEREPAPHIWLTLSDKKWINTGTAALQQFLIQLNQERSYQAAKSQIKGARRYDLERKTELVVLCLDEECVQACKLRGMFCYGGYQWSRPKQILVSTWPKLAGLIDILTLGWDTFFIDSDVSFKFDPYPHMLPLMQEFDVVGSENGVFDHINTGWMWLRGCPETVVAWKGVLARDMKKLSRDQVNFNEILDTTRLRQWRNPERRPVRSSFTTARGLRVHVLDEAIFRTYHTELGWGVVERHDSLYIHLTCGDDWLNRVFIAKTEGYWSDLDAYYSAPPRTIAVSQLSGTLNDTITQVKILLAVAHYTGRSVLPPFRADWSDLGSYVETGYPIYPIRPIYAAFPLPQIAAALNLEILEPEYVNHATRHLIGSSVLNSTKLREDVEEEMEATQDRLVKIGRLQDTVDLDIRAFQNFPDLVLRLLDQPDLQSHHAIQLINFDWPDGSWRDWELPAAVSGILPCARLDLLPSCSALCRFGPSGKAFEETPAEWESLESLVSGRVEEWDAWRAWVKKGILFEEEEAQVEQWKSLAALSSVGTAVASSKTISSKAKSLETGGARRLVVLD